MKSSLIKYIIISTIYILMSGMNNLWAQEVPPPDTDVRQQALETGEIDDDFTGTLAEDDPENEDALNELQEQEELFGNEDDQTDEDNTDDGFVEETEGTHEIHFEFTSKVQFVQTPEETSTEEDILNAPPYMEIEYITQFDGILDIKERTVKRKLEVTMEAQNWGSLAANEFFDCQLDIEMRELPVTVTTRIKKQKVNEDEEPVTDLAWQIEFDKEGVEDWFSLCSDLSGAKLNTQGNPEQYNLTILQKIEPALKAMVHEEWYDEDGLTMDLITPVFIQDDQDINNQVILSGEGSISIEPL